MNADDLETIIRNWNPNTDSVKSLKEALKMYGKDVFSLETPSLNEAIVHLEFAEIYEEMSCEAVSEFFCILTIDHEGICLLMNDEWEVESLSNLETELKNFEKINTVLNDGNHEMTKKVLRDL